MLSTDVISSSEIQNITCALCGFNNDLKDLKVFRNLVIRDADKQLGNVMGYASYPEVTSDSLTGEIEVVFKKLFDQGFIEHAYNDLIKLLFIIKLQYPTPYYYIEPSIPENVIDLPEYTERLLRYASLINSMSSVVKEKQTEIKSMFLLISAFVQLIKGYAEISGAVSDYFWIETSRSISFGKNYRFYPGLSHLIDEINENSDKRKLLLEKLALQRFRVIKNFAIEGMNLGFHQDLFKVLLKLAESAEIYIKFLIKSYDGEIDRKLLDDSISKLKEAVEIINGSSTDSSILKNLETQISQSISNLQRLQSKINDAYYGLKNYALHTEEIIKKYLTDVKTKKIAKIGKIFTLLIILLGMLTLVYDVFYPNIPFVLSIILFNSLIIRLPIYVIARDLILITLVWRSFKFIDRIIKRAETDIQKISKEFNLLRSTFDDFKMNYINPMFLWNNQVSSLFTNDIELLMERSNKILKTSTSDSKKILKELSVLIRNIGGTVKDEQ